MDQVDQIIAFEQGELDNAGILSLFSELVKSGLAWTLQGSYGRAAENMIRAGYLDRQGNVLKSFPQEED